MVYFNFLRETLPTFFSVPQFDKLAKGSFAGGQSRAIAQKSPLNALSTSAHGKY